MYEYKFEKINLDGMQSSRLPEDYHEIVNKNAAEGWRLFQIFAPILETPPLTSFIDLIFEREIKEEKKSIF